MPTKLSQGIPSQGAAKDISIPEARNELTRRGERRRRIRRPRKGLKMATGDQQEGER